MVRCPQQGPRDSEGLGSDLRQAPVPLTEQQLRGQRRGRYKHGLDSHLVNTILISGKFLFLFLYSNQLCCGFVFVLNVFSSLITRFPEVIFQSAFKSLFLK